VASGERTVVRRAREHFEAPNWSRDGRRFLYNSGGGLFELPVAGGQPKRVDRGDLPPCNNDHGFSPDGRLIAASCGERSSYVHVMNADGTGVRRVTPQTPSYWHGWSPDGQTLAFVGRRAENYDIYTVPVGGGDERRLTTAPGLDDGPDYSADGRFIYFNSLREGAMRIWRMAPDGSGQEQITKDDAYADWFPHPSPDGKWIVFLSFDKSVEGHPANKDVVLRLMPTDRSAPPRILTHLFGGQGTINVPSWSPDSTRFAFVSYRLLSPTAAAGSER
jgi:Tol biopolymer transport system component